MRFLVSNSSNSAANSKANRHRAAQLPQPPLRDRPLQLSKVAEAAVVVAAVAKLRQRTLSLPVNKPQQRLRQVLRLRRLPLRDAVNRVRHNRASSNSNRVTELMPKVVAVATCGALSHH